MPVNKLSAMAKAQNWMHYVLRLTMTTGLTNNGLKKDYITLNIRFCLQTVIPRKMEQLFWRLRLNRKLHMARLCWGELREPTRLKSIRISLLAKMILNLQAIRSGQFIRMALLNCRRVLHPIMQVLY